MTIEEQRKQLCQTIQFLLRHAAAKLDEGQNRMVYISGYLEEASDKVDKYYETFSAVQ